MKKMFLFVISTALLLSAFGCSKVEETPSEVTPDSVIEDEQTSTESTPPVKLTASDLNDILDALDLTDASLTYHNDTEETYSASAAIRSESYIEKLKSFMWEEYTPPAEWDGTDDYFYQLTTPSATITSFHRGHDESRPLHLVTETGEGWFVLPFIQNEENEATVQVSWMIYDIFSSWHKESKTALLYRGTGVTLTAEEMDYFQEYTEATWSEYDAELGGYHSGATEISCFFTSRYDDVRELNFEEFMRYFPGDADDRAHTTDLEFEALKSVEGWPFKKVENLDKMPVPVHKYPRSRVDAVLTKYAGITTAELDTTGVAYSEEYDAFYNYTSDFGPGTFIPRYGEKNGDIVTLWEAPAGYDGSTSMLTLQRSGENWHILSHQPAIYHFTAEVIKYGNDALCVKVTDAGDSTLSIGDELYVGVADGYDNYPTGCSVEVAYSGKVNVYDDGNYGPDKTISVCRVQ